MLDKRIFDIAHFGSKEEENMLQYTGFAILVHVRAENQLQAIQWAKHTYSDDGEFEERNNRYFINFNGLEVEVIADKIRYPDAYTGKSETYNLVLQAPYLGLRGYAEKKHQQLCYKLLSKIKRKRGFLMRGTKRFPISRIKRLVRLKRH